MSENWKVGDECEVLSRRDGLWHRSRIEAIEDIGDGIKASGALPSGGWRRPLDHPELRRPLARAAPLPPADPLDVVIDGLTLRYLLKCDRLNRQENETSTFSPAQRAAVSAHWSAELRAKVQAAKEQAMCTVSYCEEED